MKRAFLILAGAVIIAVGAVSVLIFFVGNSAKQDLGNETTLPDVGFPLGDGSSSEIRRVVPAEGGSIETRDFLAGAPSVPLSDTPQDIQYSLTPYGDYVPGEPYPEHAFDVQYNGLNAEFIVTLNQEPLRQVRDLAEQFLLSTLGITQSELCRLNVTVGVPYNVNPQFSSYQNLGLGSCNQPFPLP